MSAVLFALAWWSVGVASAWTDRHDRAASWVFGGALLGPLWIPIRADRRLADSLVAAGMVSPRPVLVRSRLVDRTTVIAPADRPVA